MIAEKAKELRTELIKLSSSSQKTPQPKEFLSLTDSVVKLDLSLVSSIMNYCGYKGLLNYISVMQFKQLPEYGNCYVSHQKNFRSFSFIERESEWNHFMDKLVEMKLAVKNGYYYTIRTKLKEWKEFANIHTPDCFTFHGYINFNMTKLYQERNKGSRLEDLIYLSLIDNVIKGRSISRGWKQKFTGIIPSEQRKIEKRNEDVIQVIQHYVPVHQKETENGRVGSKVVTLGQVYTDTVKVNCDLNEKKNCKVFQVGNRTQVKPYVLVSEFQTKKGFKVQKKTDLNQLNDSLEVGDGIRWRDLSAVIDTSMDLDDRSKRTHKFLNVKDKRYKTWKDFSNLEYDRILVLNEKGQLSNLRKYLNCYS